MRLRNPISLILFLIGLFLPITALAVDCCWLSDENACYNIADEQNKTACERDKGTVYKDASCKLVEGYNNCVDVSGKSLTHYRGTTPSFKFQVPFPGSKDLESAVDDPGLLAKYIVAIFQFGVWIAISFSIFMIMIAGFIWLTSAGNQTSISRAKGYITHAIVGLLIALFSYVILETINPQLVSLQMPTLPTPPPVGVSDGVCCYDPITKEVQFANLVEGQTCESAFNAFGKKWEKCPIDANSCVCRVTNTSGSYVKGDHCKNFVSKSECDGANEHLNPTTFGHTVSYGYCTAYADMCEVLERKKRIQENYGTDIPPVMTTH